MRHAQQQAGISAAAPTVSGAKHARIAEDDADAARRCRDLAMLIIMDQRTLQDLSARANQDFLTDRAINDGFTLKKPLRLMNDFLRKTEKSLKPLLHEACQKQPAPDKLVCVCESSFLGLAQTMVGTQRGRGEFRISCPPKRCVFL